VFCISEWTSKTILQKRMHQHLPKHFLMSLLIYFGLKKVQLFFWSSNTLSQEYYQIESSLLESLTTHCVNQYTDRRSDQLVFKYGTNPGIDTLSDTIIISTATDIMQKLAFSYGLTRGVKLDQLECQLGDVVEKIGNITSDLIQGVRPKKTF